MDVPAAANVLGTMGAVCWSIQLIPQIVINYRRRHAIGLQPSMMMLWACAGVPLGAYNIVRDFNVALKIQPQILTFLSLVTWIQCYYYQKKWSIPRSLTVVTPIALLMAGIQVALVVALRIARGDTTADDPLKDHWSLPLMAALSAALLAAGVLTHYWDIWKHRTVRGISFLFVGIDALGDVFSLIAVAFEPPPLDVLGMVIYGTELALWIGVFACGGYYNLLPWLRGKGVLRRDKNASADGDGDGDDAGGVGGGDARDQEGDGAGAASGITLRENPSSTSVFRTASDEGPRPRAGVAARTSVED